MRPRVRRSVYLAVRGDELLAQFTTSRRVRRYRLDAGASRLVGLLDGQRTWAAILAELREGPDYAGDASAEAALELLSGEGLVEDAQRFEDDLARLGPRCARQLEFFGDFVAPGVSPAALQERLHAARVMFIGLSGPATWAAYALALAGVGALELHDAGLVRPEGLNRHALFDPRDLGREKGAAFVERLGVVCPAVRARAHPTRVAGRGDVARVLGEVDLVIDMADEPDPNQVHEWVGAACLARRVTHIHGGGYNGKIGVLGHTVIPGHSACWVCLRARLTAPSQLEPGWAPPPGLGGLERLVGGSLGALSGIVGHFHALEALRVLTGFAPPRWCDAARQLEFFDDDRISTWPVSRDPQCPACGGLT